MISRPAESTILVTSARSAATGREGFSGPARSDCSEFGRIGWAQVGPGVLRLHMPMTTRMASLDRISSAIEACLDRLDRLQGRVEPRVEVQGYLLERQGTMPAEELRTVESMVFRILGSATAAPQSAHHSA